MMITGWLSTKVFATQSSSLQVTISGPIKRSCVKRKTRFWTIGR
jgi:hypothetical protein